jgi:hypothetical protein
LFGFVNDEKVDSPSIDQELQILHNRLDDQIDLVFVVRLMV